MKVNNTWNQKTMNQFFLQAMLFIPQYKYSTFHRSVFVYPVYPKKRKSETSLGTILTQAVAPFKALTIAVSIHWQTTSGACAVSRHRHVTVPKDVSPTFTSRKPFGPFSNDCKEKKTAVLNLNGLRIPNSVLSKESIKSQSDSLRHNSILQNPPSTSGKQSVT